MSTDIVSASVRLMTEDDDHDIPMADHTKLKNINTCPLWGILRYSLHKRMPSSARAMALEAGAAFHEAVAAVRLYQLVHFDAIRRKNLVEHHALRLFGERRYEEMIASQKDTATHRTNAINFALVALETCGFYDDPGDRRRTMSNLEECAIAYVDRWDFERYPIWIREKKGICDVGIEIPFDLHVTLMVKETVGGNEFNKPYQYRYTGKLDGLHWDREVGGRLLIQEDKTGSRLDDAWLAQWTLSHQITGYCLASTSFTNLPCDNAHVIGTRVPLGSVPGEGIRRETVPRYEHTYTRWFNWLHTSMKMDLEYRDNPTAAPMYTHSCDRYFRPCSFIPLCTADEEEQAVILEEMEHDEWSPLEDKVMG